VAEWNLRRVVPPERDARDVGPTRSELEWRGTLVWVSSRVERVRGEVASVVRLRNVDA